MALLILRSLGISLLLARAAAAGGVGEISFANSGSPAAQAAFLHGLAELHNFEYETAAGDFRSAESIDPGFAMAYWGEAMTKNHPIWMQQDLPAAREVLGRLAATPESRAAKAPTPREKRYLAALEILYGDGTKEERDLRYAEAMGALHEDYPDDVDAAAFCALSLLGTAHNGRDIPTYMRAAAILEDLFCRHPNHPGAAHYLIHAFDDPVHAPLGLRAARAYSRIAPEAAHAQHMTSHIFLALGMWDDVVGANETAVAVVNRQRAARQEPPTSCGHYAFWLEYGYLQQGRFRDANRVLEACREQAERNPPPPDSPEKLDPDNSAVGSFAQMRARYLLDAEDWSGKVARETVETGGAVSPKFEETFATAYAAARRKDVLAASRSLAELEEIARRLDPLFDKAGLARDHWERNVPGIQIDQLRALLVAAGGKPEDAVSLLRKAVSEEDRLPFAFGPPVVDKPSAELLGETLLGLDRPVEAKTAFEAALARAPKRTASLLGLLRAARAAGDKETAARAESDLRKICHAADRMPEDLR